MLSNETIQEVNTLLQQGITQRETARRTNVSLWTVNHIANGKRTLRRKMTVPEYEATAAHRCQGCGGLVNLMPCPACTTRLMLNKQ